MTDRASFYRALSFKKWYSANSADSFGSVAWLFLKLFALVYFFAFISLAFQIEGLIGSQGIMPVGDFLTAVTQEIPNHPWLQFPSVFWLNHSDKILKLVCWSGTVLSLLAFIGIAPFFIFLILWAFYLSIVSVGGVFLSFQWDQLLLETGFICLLFAPRKLYIKFFHSIYPSRAVVWLVRFLVFRLMFSSGLVKLVSGDHTWRDLTALKYHFETQPLPNMFGWVAYQSPLIVLQMATLMTLIIELCFPFLIFINSKTRRFAFVCFVILQLCIALTGNYGYFNILTIALCFFLLDDQSLNKINFFRKKILSRQPRISNIGYALRTLIIGFLVLMSVIFSVRIYLPHGNVRTTLQKMAMSIAPLRLVSHYGLFAVMTTSRDEIIIEGSNDRVVWLPYRLKYKPDEVDKMPMFVAPHQPRVDWQMWFAALSTFEESYWLQNFVGRVLQGEPTVLKFFKENPFPERPPAFIRTMSYEYHFTTWKAWLADGSWWYREVKGPYGPVVSLQKQ